MLIVITRYNRDIYRAELEALYRIRKEVFVDRLHWPLKTTDGLEIDDFDDEDTVYLASTDQNGTVTGTVRLRPSTVPNLTFDRFAHICHAPPARGAEAWEASRICTDPRLGRRDSWLARGILACGMLEFAMMQGASRYAFVISALLLEEMAQIDWDIRPLGPVQGEGNAQFLAVELHVTHQALKRTRQVYGLTSPVLAPVLEHLYEAA